jgi:hypothetical protein
MADSSLPSLSKIECLVRFPFGPLLSGALRSRMRRELVSYPAGPVASAVKPVQGVAMAACCRQEPELTLVPSLIPSTFTERRLILSYKVCFGMPKSVAVV